ncbi:MAG TPA: hypothetical protein PLD09_03005 [Methanomassiliicoccaceae archaeon]|jgi:D-aspartate ligase|nr:hypothetical protein [Methanomassiliicoccaceae archaeon]HQA20825.1 hypothetical protein [Methanomassiliicoccaceae archaeon]
MRREARAYILGVSTPNGLGAIRSLGREGVEVVAVDHQPDAAGLRSRYARPLIVPDPVARPEDALHALMSRRSGREKDVLFPTSDAFVLFLSRFREQLEERYRFCIPSRRILDGMVNKRAQYEEAMRVGAPLPLTFFPSDMSEVEDAADRLIYPAFIKPYYSHLWHPVFGNKGFKVKGPKELMERYEEVFRAGLDALVQTVIDGPNTNHVKVCAYYGLDGKRRALFLTRKIRQHPVEFGVGTTMESIHDETAQRIGLDFLDAIGYRGIGSVELKMDQRTGRYMMIELNPRLWAQNIQATYAGVNFPLIQYDDVTGGDVGDASDWQDGIRWMDAFEDARSFWWYRNRGAMRWPDLVRSWLRADCHAYLARDDMMPFLAHTGLGVEAARVAVDLLRDRGSRSAMRRGRSAVEVKADSA